MSTVKVNTISTWTGSDVGIETGKTISGTASQFKMTDVVQGDVLYGSAADTLSRLAPGTSGQVLQTQGAGANPVWAADAGGLFSAFAIFADQKSAGTAGGTATAGAWTQRDINTTIYNGDTSNIALGTNTFTLQAGNYWIDLGSTLYECQETRTRLYSVTASATVGVSPCLHASSSSIWSPIKVRVTPAVATTYRVDYRCQNTNATDGLGDVQSWGEVEQFLTCNIFKES